MIATSGGVYAAAVLGDGEVKTRHLANGAVTSPKLHNDAVATRDVKDFSLKLHDLGARDGLRTSTVSSPIVVAADQCKMVFLTGEVPAPPGLVGSLVIGHATDANGDAAVSNGGVVVPTIVSETSQGGALVSLVVCAASQQTIPTGSVFHYQVVPPGA